MTSVILLLVLTAASGSEPLLPPDSLRTPMQTDTMTEIELVIYPPSNAAMPVNYYIAWGDGHHTDWTPPLRTRVDISRYHQYHTLGDYEVTVKARDSLGRESEWTRPLPVKVREPILDWVFPTFDPIVSSPALDRKGNVYVGDESGWFYSLDRRGQLRWAREARGPIFAAATVGGGTLPKRSCLPWTWFTPHRPSREVIYVASLDSTLYCYTTEGELCWETDLGDEPYTAPALGRDGTIYVATDQGSVVALSPDGKVRWKFDTGSEIGSSPTIGPKGNVYVTCDSVFCLAATGKRRWAFSPPKEEYFFASPVVDRAGNVYIGGTNGRVYLLDSDGRVRWQELVPEEDEIRSEVSIGRGDTVYVGTDGYFLCRKAPDDTIVPLYECEDIVTSTPALARNGTIYFLSDDGYLYAMHAGGRLLWLYAIAEDEKDLYYTSSPTVGPDGTIYVGSWDGGVYAIRGESPPAKTLWPQYRHDAQHTGRLEP